MLLCDQNTKCKQSMEKVCVDRTKMPHGNTVTGRYLSGRVCVCDRCVSTISKLITTTI